MIPSMPQGLSLLATKEDIATATLYVAAKGVEVMAFSPLAAIDEAALQILSLGC